MAMTEFEVQKQINHMIAFIEQEASEKIEEIDAKAEEEFYIEKSRLVAQERLRISETYAKKEKAIDTKKKIQLMNLMNNGRIGILTGRQDLLYLVIDEARLRMAKMTWNKKKYLKILKKLILQALYLAMEPNVVIRCRERDVVLVKILLPEIIQKYIETTSMELEASVDETLFLPPCCSGGCEVIALYGRLKLDSTLDSRLDLICQQLAPQIREALFGSNPGRKFMS